MEIGGEFWLGNIPNKSNGILPEWLSKFGNVVLTSSGRGAITLLLQQLRPKANTVLLPAYICDSVILPFVKLGYKCYFYDVDHTLSPKLETIDLSKDIGVFMHMGYYGYPSNSNLTSIISELAAKSTIVVEDVTHTLFSSFPRHYKNDYYVASIRKWFGLPSGGMLGSRNSLFQAGQLSVNPVFARIRKQALVEKAQYFQSYDQELKTSYLSLFAKAESLLDEDVEPYDIDGISREFIELLDHNPLIKKRKTNFRFLLENLRDMDGIESLFTNSPEGVCPMFFPILLRTRRDQIRARLREDEIYCPIHWPVSDVLPIHELPGVAKIYDTILSLPCDQRYGTQDMGRLVSVLRRLM